MDFAGRSAIVAGGAGGLGSATVRRLASQRAGIVVLDPDVKRSGALVELIVANPYLNGEVIRLDGGARLSPQMR